MVHPFLFLACFRPPYEWRSAEQYRAAGGRATTCIGLRIRAAAARASPMAFSREAVSGSRKENASNKTDSQIRSRVSQIAAAILFDFRTVDIRRVGTHQKRIFVMGCSE
jgi:hypothetical protein